MSKQLTFLLTFYHQPLVETTNALGYTDSGINISEELRSTSIWQSMASNQKDDTDSNDLRERKPHKHRHRHHHHHKKDKGRSDGSSERKLSTVADAPDLEVLASEDTGSVAIPLITLTTVDERNTDV